MIKQCFVVRFKSESGDHYGPFVFGSKPNNAQLKKLIKEEMSWEAEYSDGPGIFGTYLYSEISKTEIRKLK